MPLPVIADTIRASQEGLTSNGLPWANVMHFRKTGALSYPAAIAILDPIWLAIWNTASGGGTALRAFLPTTASLQAFRYTPLDGSTASTVNTHVVAGTDAGDPLPASTCLVATLRTALRGRANRGRVYFGPMTELSNTNGRPTAGTVSGLSLQMNALITNLTGSGVSLVVASYLPPGVANNVTVISVNGRWDTQRRRLGA